MTKTEKRANFCAGVVLGITALFLLLPELSLAQPSLEVVPCGNEKERPCTVCDFYVLAANVFRFMLYTATFLAILYVAWGGFLMLTSGANPAGLTSGKKAVWSAIIGLVVAFSSWLVVNTFINLLIEPGAFTVPWSEAQCK